MQWFFGRELRSIVFVGLAVLAVGAAEDDRVIDGALRILGRDAKPVISFEQTGNASISGRLVVQDVDVAAQLVETERLLAVANEKVAKMVVELKRSDEAIRALSARLTHVEADVRGNVLRKDVPYDLSPSDKKDLSVDFWRDGIRKNNSIQLWERNGTNGQRFVLRDQPPER